MNGSRQMKIELIDATGRLAPEDLKWLASQISRAAGVLEAHGEARVRIVNDVEMALAHVEFSGVEGTTDVLTFDLTDPDENPNSEPAVRLGVNGQVHVLRTQGIDTDILACRDEAERQSTARGTATTDELLLYSVHGILHCLGFDDHEEADFERMHAVEDAVLTQIGVGPIYRREDPGSG
jgi:probable rRNA maturation factor